MSHPESALLCVPDIYSSVRESRDSRLPNCVIYLRKPLERAARFPQDTLDRISYPQDEKSSACVSVYSMGDTVGPLRITLNSMYDIFAYG